MKCCINCFNDYYLKEYIENNSDVNDCDFCMENNVYCIETEKLSILFKELMEIYESSEFSFSYRSKDNDGIWHKHYLNLEYDSLIGLIQQDWNLFNSNISENKMVHLMYNITNTLIFGQNAKIEDYEKAIWIRVYEKYGGYFCKKDWHIFKKFIKNKYRFIIDQLDDTEFGFNPTDMFLNRLVLRGEFYNYIFGDSKLYRARINKDNQLEPFLKEKMGIPDETILTYGRANPVGINYLYTSDTIETVMAEVRAWKGSRVSVAEIKINHDEELLLLDLTKAIEPFSPFDLSSFIEIIHLFESKMIAEVISEDISKPVNPDTASVDYIPTQYICELARLFSNNKHKGIELDGIKFKSSLGEGNNIVLFNMDKVTIYDVNCYTVSRIDYDIQKSFG